MLSYPWGLFFSRPPAGSQDEAGDLLSRLPLKKITLPALKKRGCGNRRVRACPDPDKGCRDRAIYLAGILSQFDVTTPDNELMGRVTRTSVALTEAGELFVVQEMDLTASSREAMA